MFFRNSVLASINYAFKTTDCVGVTLAYPRMEALPKSEVGKSVPKLPEVEGVPMNNVGTFGTVKPHDVKGTQLRNRNHEQGRNDSKVFCHIVSHCTASMQTWLPVIRL